MYFVPETLGQSCMFSLDICHILSLSLLFSSPIWVSRAALSCDHDSKRCLPQRAPARRTAKSPFTRHTVWLHRRASCVNALLASRGPFTCPLPGVPCHVWPTPSAWVQLCVPQRREGHTQAPAEHPQSQPLSSYILFSLRYVFGAFSMLILSFWETCDRKGRERERGRAAKELGRISTQAAAVRPHPSGYSNLSSELQERPNVIVFNHKVSSVLFCIVLHWFFVDIFMPWDYRC